MMKFSSNYIFIVLMYWIVLAWEFGFMVLHDNQFIPLFIDHWTFQIILPQVFFVILWDFLFHVNDKSSLVFIKFGAESKLYMVAYQPNAFVMLEQYLDKIIWHVYPITSFRMYVLTFEYSVDMRSFVKCTYLIMTSWHRHTFHITGPLGRDSYHKGWQMWSSGPHLNIKTVFTGMLISIIKIRWSWDCLLFMMGMPILVRQRLYIETAPWWFLCY